MDVQTSFEWATRLESGDALIRKLAECRELAAKAQLGDHVDRALLHVSNLARIYHDTAPRNAARDTLKPSKGKSE